MTSGNNTTHISQPINKIDSVLAWLNSQYTSENNDSNKQLCAKNVNRNTSPFHESKRCRCHQQASRKVSKKKARSSSSLRETVAHYSLRSQTKCSTSQSFSIELPAIKDIGKDGDHFTPSSTSDYGSFSTRSSNRRTPRSSLGLTSSSTESKHRLEGISKWDSIQSDEDTLQENLNSRVITYQGVTVIIPKFNLSGFSLHDFALELIYDPSYSPKAKLHFLHASDVVSVEPHGTTFYKSHPAYISIPLKYDVGANDEIICMYSNTSEGQVPSWEPLPSECHQYSNGRLIVTAEHFSLFTIVIKQQYPEVRRRIGRHGGKVVIETFPGLEVYFPPNSLDETISAFVKLPHEQDYHQGEYALASPIVMVGPHGYQFSPGSQPVRITIPIPHYDLIKRRFGHNAKLTVWQSATAEGEPLNWEQVEGDTRISQDANNNFTISFYVEHFSFFKALWDVLSETLYEAKLGVAFFYPFISFSMMSQAWMEENRDTLRFGLQIVIYRSDKKPESANYKYRVGSCLNPKLVRPGKIIVRLKSEMFDADVAAGEDPSLLKEETDFRGREFDKQFACRFKDEDSTNRGSFGKVIIERYSSLGNELLFEFNLHKTGFEGEVSLPETSDRWSMVAIKELALILGITENSNWKNLAKHVGFTKNEVVKLRISADPFLTMMNLYQSRGGTPEEFVQALYSVGRDIKVKDAETSGNSSPSGSSGSGSWKKKFWPLSSSPAIKWRDRGTDSDNDSNNTASTSTSIPRKRRLPTVASKDSGSSKRRRQFSDVSETMSSSQDSLGTEEHVKDRRKLEDTDLWQISSYINTQNWRALGRTLGLEECVLMNIEHGYRSTGFRECSYQMLVEWRGRKPKSCTFGILYKALMKENMVVAAKQMATMKIGEEANF